MGKRKQVQVPVEKIEEQNRFIEAIAEKNSRYFAINKRKPKYMIQTFGCQMNEHDSENLAGMLDAMGYEATLMTNDCDLIIYNTCAVRENAELKVYGNLGHLKLAKRKNPDLKIAVCGCMMQQPHVVKEIKSKYKHVDLVFGTHNLYKFPELLTNTMDSDSILVDVWDVDGEVVEGLRSSRKFELKAFVNIMYGCNNFCTYCIVPYTRGRERSRTPEDIINEIKELAANGTKEITLLGQNVDSYGKTLEEDITFAQLLRMVNEVEGLERIRFMTSHPKDISDEVIYAMRDCDKVCEFLHLPVQCGSTSLLKKMNRHYSKEDYLRIIEKAKAEIPGIAFSTDLMIGFPGETEEDLLDTIDVVEKVKYDNAFTFIYSKREGTPAAKMEDQIPEDVKHERFNRVLAKVNEILAGLNAQYVGKTVEVLIEGKSKTDESKFTGRTRQNKLVNFTVKNPEADLLGKLMNVKITEATTFSLVGEEV
ncbi:MULTISPECIES: tRNA (N6-isopentenyl adenosine(37)-C2)-methylthiotransferase MiaB [Terrisporobacter]|uniref:tRNA-2-methylthio-N(6)-dimethylallyladenosine synthase n=2 Tax=Terrisporobacter TaxID=1505652 RepID=A0A0B3VST9_9FIRM|nr:MULTISPECIES: tRNA (N6-isopentenyl adenosine(37)-C2)-methylthiotransferase MiaB [Terrisporobacter]KHS55898.1 (dimethylallyl)adenosine tRNA methylthiotransferase [Terrisporobacter othiniensis]MCC3669040.1 tRNA (N6-isopentenyl adenosine(37)-C2)-methylthiotransferase MiaB [Terrisporobacter mayombei]MCR1824205.1 tRNA (N6-isopentenyl adenosine(37)-C2)-methylthiotransferase MiaB [Terrisporobacter muris]MDU6985614.1 tRNA (N6-isopentenyl adenosine(37)-C2)-methylthiotransferase MiaB [Terrisporobacter